MMKNVILGLIAAAAMTSCIKKEEVSATDQNSNLGKAVITGTILAKTDYLGDTLPNGNTDFDNLGVSGLSGLNVTARYNTEDLDPDGINGEEISVSTTTNANGKYTLAIDAAGEGNTVTVIIDGIVTADVYHNNSGRCETDTTGQIIPKTETLTFKSSSISSSYRSYNVTVSNGQTITKDKQVIEADEL